MYNIYKIILYERIIHSRRRSKRYRQIRHPESCPCSCGITIIGRIAAVFIVDAVWHIAAAAVDVVALFKIIGVGLAAKKRIRLPIVHHQHQLQLCPLPTRPSTNDRPVVWTCSYCTSINRHSNQKKPMKVLVRERERERETRNS
jgi:hypothetical protein